MTAALISEADGLTFIHPVNNRYLQVIHDLLASQVNTKVTLTKADGSEVVYRRVTSGQPISEDVDSLLYMPKVLGRPFKCPCGCNVFRKVDVFYICNACETEYLGTA